MVFGCLGAMACLGHIRLPAGWSAKSLEAEFGRPMFLGVAYRIETSQKDGKWRARLFDGSAVVVSLTVTAELSNGNEMLEETAAASAFARCDAAIRQEEDIIPGLAVSGFYACNSLALATLALRWGCVDRFLAKLLCWSSYLVGMELPGESALFSKLVLHLRRTDPCPATMAYRASVASIDSRFGQVVMDASLLHGDSTVASGQLCSLHATPRAGSGGDRFHGSEAEQPGRAGRGTSWLEPGIGRSDEASSGVERCGRVWDGALCKFRRAIANGSG